MIKFDIAGILFHIISEDFDHSNFISFYSNSQEKEDILVYIKSNSSIPQPESKVLLNEEIKWFRNSDNESSISISTYQQDTNQMDCMMQVDNNWESASLTCRKKDSDFYVMNGPLGEILFRNKIIFHRGLVVHAAAIEWEGKGIMFSAPSGTGKSTQADLWKRYMGAVVLNGDRPAIRVLEDQPYVYGTPWSGSSPEYLNRRAPLKAIILLEQAKENKIRQLDSHEALVRLLPRCFIPYFAEGEIMNLALENLERIIMVTPIYLLSCRPDKEAVELVYECVK